MANFVYFLEWKWSKRMSWISTFFQSFQDFPNLCVLVISVWCSFWLESYHYSSLLPIVLFLPINKWSIIALRIVSKLLNICSLFEPISFFPLQLSYCPTSFSPLQQDWNSLSCSKIPYILNSKPSHMLLSPSNINPTSAHQFNRHHIFFICFLLKRILALCMYLLIYFFIPY